MTLRLLACDTRNSEIKLAGLSDGTTHLQFTYVLTNSTLHGHTVKAGTA